MVVQYIHGAATSDNWDRLPLPTAARRAKRVTAARRRRVTALARGRRILALKTTGDEERVAERMRRVSELYQRYRLASAEIIQAELLD
jgi:hypothetical protein